MVSESIYGHSMGFIGTGLLSLGKPVRVTCVLKTAADYSVTTHSLSLKQMVTKATRVTRTSKTMIDHMITNTPKRITYTEVSLCPLVSEHEAPYACVNAQISCTLCT